MPITTALQLQKAFVRWFTTIMKGITGKGSSNTKWYEAGPPPEEWIK